MTVAHRESGSYVCCDRCHLETVIDMTAGWRTVQLAEMRQQPAPMLVVHLCDGCARAHDAFLGHAASSLASHGRY